ncbi:MAG TPA: AsmA family protein [Candidatus Acidoferrales bacterium]|jgi:AsmA protein|nr:AsmA family protein [Candidatus Acidoferrales bacterium]
MARKIIYIVGGLIVLLVLVAVLLPFFIDVNRFKPQIESAAQSSLGRTVAIGNIQLALFSGGVAVADISVSEDPAFGSGAFLKAKSVEVRVEIMPLIFSRQLHVTGVVIDQPEVMLLRAPSGGWNFSSLGAKGTASPASSSSSSGSAADVSVQKIEIKNGKLTVGQAGPNAKQREYDQMNLTASDLSYTSQFPFTFAAVTPGNGTIKLTGKAGPLSQIDAAQTPVEASLEIHGLDLTATGFMDPSSGIAGVLDFAGTLSSDGQQANSKGTITASKLKFVPGGSPAGEPVQVDYDTNYELKPQTGSLRQGDVHIGKAVAHLTGTFNSSAEVPSVAMKLTGADMLASDLESVLPAVGVTLPSGASLKEGTMNLDLAITGPLDKLVTTGPVKLSNGKLVGFDLGAKMGALSSFAGIPKGSDTEIQTFSSDLRIAPQGIRSDNLNVVVPAIGSITGSGTIGADQTLNFLMVAHLSASNNPMGKIAGLTSAGGGQKGSEGGMPFKIQGTTSKPEFIPEVGAMAGSIVKGAVGSVPASGQDIQNLGKQVGGLFGKKKQ